MTLCVTTVSEMQVTLDEARTRGASIGLVPTMGGLHEGHLSLVRRARSENGLVVVSIFVNPTQFGPHEDLQRYPRDLAGDLVLAREAGGDLVFSPTVEEMYPEAYSTWVEVDGLTAGLCGASRPGHFRGVCTVVTKLLNICRPERAYFGQKDAQQLAVVKRMVRDLNLGVDIVSCPTVREADGLAVSSRNTGLTAQERVQAPVLYRALRAAAELVQRGERDASALEEAIRGMLAEADLGRIDYVDVVRANDLSPMTTVSGECLIAVALWFGGTRLIDNIVVTG
ncbi:MAG: pantoate--beta-alanine ligase [bacterium]